METKKGYRIADFENALPKGAVFDEVVYQSNSGQRVKYVHGVVGDGVRVTWDFIGKCYRRRNWVRMPEWDLKMGESAQACAATELLHRVQPAGNAAGTADTEGEPALEGTYQ